ncbi:hypothetical protein SRHO_G00200560 [Serrasalmus rhombeus]
MQSQRRNNLTGEETAGKPPQEPPSPQNLRCFQDVLHIVSSLTDREWRTLSEDVPHAVTKLQFATLCTKIILSDSKSAVQSYLPSLLRVIGMEAVLRAEQNVREKAECASVNPSGSNTAEETSHKRSPVDQSDLICHIVEDFASEVKMAMESLLQMSQLQHPKRSSDPVPDTSCVRNSQLRDPGQGPSSLNYFVVDESVETLLKHLLSLNTRSSPAADPSTSAGSKGQDRHSDNPGKTSSKVFPVNMMSDHHQSTSSSGNHQKSEQRESAFRRTRKNISRIFTAIRKAVPNPFQCM